MKREDTSHSTESGEILSMPQLLPETPNNPYAPQHPYAIIPPSYPPQPRRPLHPLTLLLSLLALITLAHFIAVAHTGTVSAAPTTCSALLHTTDYTKFVPMQPQQSMNAVQFVTQLVPNQPTVIVSVSSSQIQHPLDVYVYGCTMQQQTPTLALLFKRQGLIQGTVSMSQADTLLVSYTDSSFSPQNTIMQQTQQTSIYQEYIWHNGNFVQTSFPALYPVLSRGEAETLQQQANSGQSFLWQDPLSTAEQMTRDLLQWSGHNTNNKVLDNNGTIAHVQLFQQSPAITLNVTLSRLIQHNNMGLWFVTNAQTQGLTLQLPRPTNPISSPVTLAGTTTLSDGTLTTTLFDHALSQIPTLHTATLSVQSNGLYSGNVAFTNNQPNQPALLLITDTPPIGSSEPELLVLQSVILM